MKFVTRSLFSLFLLSGLLSSQVVTTLVTGPSTFNDGLAIDQQGNIYASMYLGSTVTKITPAGQTSIFASGMTSPNGLAFGPDGNLYVPNALGAKITKITPAGDTSTFLAIPDPGALLFNPDGSILVAQYNLNKISLIDTNKNVSVFLDDTKKLNGPIGLVRDRFGILYVGNFNDGKVFRYTAAQGLQLIGQVPGSLGFMSVVNNMIFATAYTGHRIYQIPTSGGGATIFAGNGTPGSANGTSKATFHNPNGIVASLTGDSLYVSDYTTRSLRVISGILKFTTSVLRTERTPNDYRLSQNYPNPFNPSTTITFSVPVQSPVELKVYSLLGTEVATIADGIFSAGHHSVPFHGNTLASGVYLIRMVSGGKVLTMKATLVK